MLNTTDFNVKTLLNGAYAKNDYSDLLSASDLKHMKAEQDYDKAELEQFACRITENRFKNSLKHMKDKIAIAFLETSNLLMTATSLQDEKNALMYRLFHEEPTEDSQLDFYDSIIVDAELRYHVSIDYELDELTNGSLELRIESMLMQLSILKEASKSLRKKISILQDANDSLNDKFFERIYGYETSSYQELQSEKEKTAILQDKVNALRNQMNN